MRPRGKASPFERRPPISPNTESHILVMSYRLVAGAATLVALSSFQDLCAQELAYALGDEATHLSDFGYSVADAGDVDFDGVPDVLIGSPFDSTSGASAGATRIYSGKSGGLLWTRLSAYPGDLFGWSVDGIGDITGDGASEVIVGSPLFDNNGAGHSSAGRVDVISPAGNWTVISQWSTSANAQLGSIVRGLGDISGDGIPDYAYGSPRYDHNGLNDCGAIFVYSGYDQTFIWAEYGTEDGEYFGWSVDSYRNATLAGSRILIGAPGYDGGGTNVGRVVFRAGDGFQVHSKTGFSNNGWFGFAVTGTGDSDFAISAPYIDYLGIGADAGLVNAYSGVTHNIKYSITGDHAGARLGISLSRLGFYDTDATRDLLIGSPFSNYGGASEAGEARVVSGVDGSPLASFSATSNDHTGRSVSNLGDLNGDGFGDFVIGIPDGQFGSGAAQVHLSWVGSPSIYCTAKVNSQGCIPGIRTEGLPSLSIANNFDVIAENVLNQKVGLMLWGQSLASVPFFGGTLCVAGSIQRTTPQSSAGSLGAPDCSGSYRFHFSQDYMTSQGLTAGDRVRAQFWSRDTADPHGVGLTDAVHFAIVP
jgi:hypothetical protein